LLLGQLIGVARLVHDVVTVVVLWTLVLVDVCVREEDRTTMLDEDVAGIEEASKTEDEDETIAIEEVDDATGVEEEDKSTRLEEDGPVLLEKDD
jgi:hypothetical protein